MRMIKLFAWEPKVKKQISESREDELRLIKKGAVVASWSGITSILLTWFYRQYTWSFDHVCTGVAPSIGHGCYIRYLCETLVISFKSCSLWLIPLIDLVDEARTFRSVVPMDTGCDACSYAWYTVASVVFSSMAVSINRRLHYMLISMFLIYLYPGLPDVPR